MKQSDRKTSKAETKKTVIRDRVDSFLMLRRKFRGYVTLCTVLLLFLLYLAARTYSGHDDPAQLRFVENPTEATKEPGANGNRTSTIIFTGEAHDTAQRLRECGSLLIAVSLSAFEEFRIKGKFPESLDEILSGVQKRSLLPPGIEIRGGSLHSSLSELKLSYASDPFSFEIIALPTEGVQGPAMMFRFPLPPSGSNSIMYFESWERQPIPPPFRTAEQLVAVGWTIRHWRFEALPLDEGAVRDLWEQEAWLKTLTRGDR